MNESWADLDISHKLKLEETVMPNIEKISKEESALWGKVVVPTFGGGTNKSEFAFLTGSVMDFGLTGSCYDLDCEEGTASIVQSLKELGYYTIAVHPAYSKNWDRDIGYKKLGFDEYLSLENLSNYDFDYLRSYSYVSDSSLYEVIYDITDKNNIQDTPLFIFCVTIQNHGDYNDDAYMATLDVEDPQVAQYLSLIKETDKAFAEMIEHYRQKEKETVILMFGDHMPSLDNIDSLVPKESIERYTTPYIFWSNSMNNISCELSYLSCCNVNYLQIVLLEAAGLPLNNYQQLLKYTAQKYPVIKGGKYYDNNMVWEKLSYSNIAKEIDDYRIVQYNNLFGGKDRYKILFSYGSRVYERNSN